MATGKLSEVEQDAIRLTEKRFRDQEEERQYNASKAAEVKPAKGVVTPAPEAAESVDEDAKGTKK